MSHPLLTTFNTPQGRFRFVCLPWGLACVQDIFQWMMDQSLACCGGVIGIVDDVAVHGKDDKEHDKHLHKFMRVTHEHRLVFNRDKCAVKQTSIVFFICVYDTTGTHPDPEKVNAVHKMPAPETVPQIGNLPVTLSTITLLLHNTPMWAAEERNRVHLEQFLSGSIWETQIIDLQGYHTVVLWCPQACHHPSWCIPKRPRCHPPSRWLPSCLCFQGSYPCGAVLCQHRMWTACLCLQSRMIPHLCLWPCLHYWEWPWAS